MFLNLKKIFFQNRYILEPIFEAIWLEHPPKLRLLTEIAVSKMTTLLLFRLGTLK